METVSHPRAAAPAPRGTPPSGFLLLDKPPGISSFAALFPVKRFFKAFRNLKVGHAGTLDPAASGLLVAAVGGATRLLEYLEVCDKGYDFDLVLGVETDTYDLEGEVVQKRDADHLEAAQVEAALSGFRGPLSQSPPRYSAVKIAGKRACDRVRAGEEVTLAPRPVTVHGLSLLSFAPPRAALRLHCSKGFYVRTLAHELGRALGVGAVADRIRRTQVGPFGLEGAVSADTPDFAAHLLPPETALPGFRRATLSQEGEGRLLSGSSLPPRCYALSPAAPGASELRDPEAPLSAAPSAASSSEELVAVFSPLQALLAVAHRDALGTLHPRKVLGR